MLTSLIEKLEIEKSYKTYSKAIPGISIALVSAGVVLVLVIVWLRLAHQNNLGEDILLAALALLLATAGIALSALANGMQIKLMLEAANIEAQQTSAVELLELRQKLLSGFSDRLGSISILPSCLLTSSNSTIRLTCSLKDSSGKQFKGDETVFKAEWTSTNSGVATVDGNGMITRVAAGQAEVVASFYGFRSNACLISCG